MDLISKLTRVSLVFYTIVLFSSAVAQTDSRDSLLSDLICRASREYIDSIMMVNPDSIDHILHAKVFGYDDSTLDSFNLTVTHISNSSSIKRMIPQWLIQCSSYIVIVEVEGRDVPDSLGIKRSQINQNELERIIEYRTHRMSTGFSFYRVSGYKEWMEHEVQYIIEYKLPERFKSDHQLFVDSINVDYMEYIPYKK